MTTRLKLTHGFSSQNPIYPPITKNVFVSEGEDFAKSVGCSDCFWLRTTLKINTIRNRMPIKEILFCLIIQGSKLTVIGENIYLNPLELSHLVHQRLVHQKWGSSTVCSSCEVRLKVKKDRSNSQLNQVQSNVIEEWTTGRVKLTNKWYLWLTI